MKELFGHRLPRGRYFFQEMSARERRARQEGIRLNFQVNSSRREAALSLVVSDLADQAQDWVLPLGATDGPWRINLPKLAAGIPPVRDQTWLEGERVVTPDFDIIESPFTEGRTAVVRLTLLVSSRAMLTTIPSAQGLTDPLGAFLADHTDPNRCGFLMMPFQETPVHGLIDRCVRRTCKAMGLIALRADRHYYSDDILANIRTYMHGCGFGIAIFEAFASDYFNSNIALEVGYMLALGKPVCLLKDSTISALQTDLAGLLYEKFDAQHVEGTIPRALRKWLREKRLAS